MARLYFSEEMKFELSVEALVCLAEHAARRFKYESALVQALLELDIPSITSTIAENIDIDEVPEWMANRLWDNASPEGRYQIIDTSVLKKLTKKQLDDIISDGHVKTLKYVARNFEDTESSPELCEADRKKFLEFLRRHHDNGVLVALAENDNITELLEKWNMDFSLEERIKLNTLSVEIIKKHKAAEIAKSETLSPDTMEWLSEHIDELDKQVNKRKALAQLLIDNKDPKFRQTMAQSSCMPRDILLMLARGDDPVAARYAKVTLAETGDDDDDE